MSLSDYEKQILAQMEAQLSNQDPRLVDRMRETSKAPSSVSRPRRVAFGVVLVLVGVVVLVAGLVSSSTVFRGYEFLGALIGVLGFVLVVVGVLQIFGIGVRSTDPKPPARRPAPAASGGGFMDRQQEKWDRRRRPQV